MFFAYCWILFTGLGQYLLKGGGSLAPVPDTWACVTLPVTWQAPATTSIQTLPTVPTLFCLIPCVWCQLQLGNSPVSLVILATAGISNFLICPFSPVLPPSPLFPPLSPFPPLSCTLRCEQLTGHTVEQSTPAGGVSSPPSPSSSTEMSKLEHLFFFYSISELQTYSFSTVNYSIVRS